MKSICIKINNTQIISYLLKEFENISLNDIYISQKKFKNYENIILHYKGEDINLFLTKVSEILTYCIFLFFEKKLIKNLIEYNFFYFNTFEQEQISDTAISFLSLETDTYQTKYNVVFNSTLDFLKENKTMLLNGFINFRLKEYIKLIDANLELAVNTFVIEREYYEFIHLLRLYVDSKYTDNPENIIHLIYKNKKSILIDKNKNSIQTNDNIFKAKYLSDISFSSNDIALNTLIDLIPSKIYVHLIDEYVDEFINTLKLIFENHLIICTDCDICELYKLDLQQNL